MTHLRKIMLEELQRRNYAQHTTRSYIRQPPACHAPTALLSPARLGTTAESRTRHLFHRRLVRSLALPPVCWPDEGHRAAYRCRNPTSLSTRGHRCSMKALSAIRTLHVPRCGSHLSAWPSDRSLLSASATAFFSILFRHNQLLHNRCHVLHPRARPWPTSTPLLPIIESP